MIEEKLIASTKLSIVLTGRNDNYGGNFSMRLQNCINALHSQLKQNNISSEIIFVNYNPLTFPPIEAFIYWPKSDDLIKITIITVSHEHHVSLVESSSKKYLPILEFLAKNVGIRQASGEFILCMNADIIIPEGFFALLTNPNPNYYYRADRHDFDMQIAQNVGMKHAVIRVLSKGFTYTCSPKKIDKKTRFKMDAWKLLDFLSYHFFTFLGPYFRVPWNTYFTPKAEMHFHCNASGDFFIMHRDIWHLIRGYNESVSDALHVDSLLVIQSAVCGLKEFILPLPIYHQDHERRYNPNVQFTNYNWFQKEAQQMLKSRKLTIHNSANWGMANFTLSKTVL